MHLTRTRCVSAIAAILAWLFLLPASSLAQTLQLNFTPSQSTVEFTLDASLHTVHGTCALKSGSIQYDPANGAIKGEILVDATSGRTGNDSRDTKMHKDILESARYPEITFLPEQIEEKVQMQGKSTVQVHGTFGVHGATHKITAPAEIEIANDHWTADVHFTIPYVDWGMKNPSNFILHVGKTVDIHLHATGMLPATTQK